jgi:glycosyltransferase involved in cell wall biosynthesis
MLLSVISIAYRNLHGLQKTLSGFEGHACDNDIEIIVVDGGSDDGTREFLAQQTISKKWVSEPDGGIYHAMNKGLAMASGDYVWFLNSGDFVMDRSVVPEILESLRKGPDALYGETMMVDKEGRHLGTRSEKSTRKLPDKLHWKSFAMGMNVGHQSFLIRRELALPYQVNYRYVADIDWMISCLKNCRHVLRFPKVIACFTLDGFSSANRKNSNKERYQVLKKHYGFLPNLLNHGRIAWRKVIHPSGL